MFVRRRIGRSGLWACIFLWLLATGCEDAASSNDEDDDGTAQTHSELCVEDEALRNTVEASEWATERAGIAAYDYRANVLGGLAMIDLLDDSGEVLGTMIVRQLYDDPFDPPGVMEASIQLDEEAEESVMPMRLVTWGENVNRSGYTVGMRLERLNEEAGLHLTARFKTVRCWQAEDPVVGPGCVGELPLDSPLFTLPSCGLIVDERIHESLPPELDRLTYAVPEADVETVPKIGGTYHDDRLRDPNSTRLYSLDVFHADGVRDEQEVEQWLSQTGADAVVGTEAERLLTTAYLDRSWWRAMEHHVAHCDVERLPRPQIESESAEENEEETEEEASDAENEIEGESQGSENGEEEELQELEMSLCPGDENPGDWSSRISNFIANIWGDPHIVTLDDYGYDLQAAGEFVLVEAHAGEPFMLQGRFEPLSESTVPGCGDLTWNSAAATEIAGKRITVQSHPEWQVLIDGQPVDAADELPELDGQASITIEDGRVSLGWPDGEKVNFIERFSNSFDGGSLTVEVDLPPHRRGQVRGLMGQFDGDSGTDLVLPDGTILNQPASFEELYEILAPSWRVRASNSLFDYDGGQGPDDFYIDDFPSEPTTVSNLPQDRVHQAEQTCLDEGISDGHILDACIIDVVCFDDDAQAEASKDIPAPVASQPPGRHDLMVERAVRLTQTPEELVTEGAALDCSPSAEPSIALFEEQSSMALQDSVDVDLSQPGTYTADGELSSTSIGSGTEVTSYQLVRRTPENPAHLYAGAVRFAQPIAGVIVDEDVLSDTDASLGADETSYEAGAGLRGLRSPQDQILIDEEQHRLELVWSGTQAHRIRVLVESQ